MKLRFRALYYAFLALCLGVLGWSLWSAFAADAEATTTNAPATSRTAAWFPPPAPLSERTHDVLTFGLNRLPALQHEVFGQPLWKYLASLLYIVLALYSSKVLDWLVAHRLKRWAERTATRFDDLLIELVRGPVKVVAFVILLHIGLRLITWSPWIERYLTIGLRLVVAWSITYMVLKALDLLLGYWKQRAATEADKLFSDHLYPVIRKTLRGLLILGAVLLTADNLGFKVTSILAGLSIGGLALGLAAQDTVANVFGAVAIFLDRPFRIGDRIRVDTYDGVVEAIGLRSTRIRSLEGFLVTIPNKTMGNANITNVSARPTIRSLFNLGITYDTPPAKVQEALSILRQVFRAHPNTADVLITFNEYAASALNLQIVHWWNNTDFRAYLAGLEGMNLEIKEKFDRAGIGFAFPTQTLYVRQDSDWRWSGAPPATPERQPPGPGNA